MIPLALASGTACILAYGQTGTGKTYTMEAIEYRVARDLFVAAERIGGQLLEAERKAGGSSEEALPGITHGKDVFEFTATFLELLGKRAVDLLEPVNGLPVDEQGNLIRQEVAIQEDKVTVNVVLHCGDSDSFPEERGRAPEAHIYACRISRASR